MTTRERREARAEKLREWADKREARSEAEYAKARQIGDMIPFGQPILVGHHSEGRHRRDIARIDTAMSRSVESARMAQSMASRADNIEAATDGSIFDDDPDAIEALTERIALLEAERDRIKAYNASCRKGSPDESVLDDRQRADLASCRDLEARGHHVLAKGGAFPTYKLSNLSANIKRNRDRIPVIQRRQARAMTARYTWCWVHAGYRQATLGLSADHEDVFEGVPPERAGKLDPFEHAPADGGPPMHWPDEVRLAWYAWSSRSFELSGADRRHALPRLIAEHHLGRAPSAAEIAAVAKLTRAREVYAIEANALDAVLPKESAGQMSLL